ncbi:MAG: YafY family transcriptional regulator [Xanthomonadales bacterium]|nr:YafY family transcriptional regulator [Xanthomonadales bacterium]
MDRLERITRLHRRLSVARTGAALETLMEELDCSRATVYRDIAFLRDALGAPIEHDHETQRWKYVPQPGEQFELPGLWLSEEEIYALLVAQQTLSAQSDGLLAEALGDLRPRLKKVMGDRIDRLGRIRVLKQGARRVAEGVFSAVANGVLERRQLRFEYRARSTEERTRRLVSPQRLIHYRDNWYLDAFDHDRQALRSFSLDRIGQVQILDEAAEDLPEERLDAQLGAGYGIFSGAPRAVATLRFTAHAARWLAEERWHREQSGRFREDGSYELKVPYANSRELLMDVLRFGPDCEVIAPASLREEMRSLLVLTESAYGG